MGYIMANEIKVYCHRCSYFFNRSASISQFLQSLAIAAGPVQQFTQTDFFPISLLLNVITASRAQYDTPSGNGD